MSPEKFWKRPAQWRMHCSFCCGTLSRKYTPTERAHILDSKYHECLIMPDVVMSLLTMILESNTLNSFRDNWCHRRTDGRRTNFHFMSSADIVKQSQKYDELCIKIQRSDITIYTMRKQEAKTSRRDTGPPGRVKNIYDAQGRPKQSAASFVSGGRTDCRLKQALLQSQKVLPVT